MHTRTWVKVKGMPTRQVPSGERPGTTKPAKPTPPLKGNEGLPSPVKRGRGRPRKVAAAAEPAKDSGTEAAIPLSPLLEDSESGVAKEMKPEKPNPFSETATATGCSCMTKPAEPTRPMMQFGTNEPAKRSRGRPRKVPTASACATEVAAATVSLMDQNEPTQFLGAPATEPSSPLGDSETVVVKNIKPKEPIPSSSEATKGSMPAEQSLNVHAAVFTASEAAVGTAVAEILIYQNEPAQFPEAGATEPTAQPVPEGRPVLQDQFSNIGSAARAVIGDYVLAQLLPTEYGQENQFTVSIQNSDVVMLRPSSAAPDSPNHNFVIINPVRPQDNKLDTLKTSVAPPAQQSPATPTTSLSLDQAAPATQNQNAESLDQPTPTMDSRELFTIIFPEGSEMCVGIGKFEAFFEEGTSPVASHPDNDNTVAFHSAEPGAPEPTEIQDDSSEYILTNSDFETEEESLDLENGPIDFENNSAPIETQAPKVCPTNVKLLCSFQG